MVRHANRYSSTELTPLTFEEICPAWSDKLKKDLSNDDTQILVRKPQQCIVGEAWGYTSRYLGSFFAGLEKDERTSTCRMFRMELWRYSR